MGSRFLILVLSLSLLTASAAHPHSPVHDGGNLMAAQASPYLRSHAGDPVHHPCLGRADGRVFAQLRWWEPTQALGLAWAAPRVPLDELVAATAHLASARRIDFLLLTVRRAEAASVPCRAARAGEVPIVERAIGP